jgi:hypothetical protein
MDQTLALGEEITCQIEGCSTSSLFCVTHNDAPNIRFYCQSHLGAFFSNMDARFEITFVEMARGELRNLYLLGTRNPSIVCYAKFRMTQLRDKHPRDIVYNFSRDFLEIGKEWAQMNEHQRQPFFYEDGVEYHHYVHQVKDVLVHPLVKVDKEVEEKLFKAIREEIDAQLLEEAGAEKAQHQVDADY